MEIYRLSGRGVELSHSYRHPNTPEWSVVHFLAKHGGTATKQQILEYVPSANSITLARLRLRGVVLGEETQAGSI